MADFSIHAVAASTAQFSRITIARLDSKSLATSGSGTDSVKLAFALDRRDKTFSEWDQVFGGGEAVAQLPANRF